VNSVEKYWKKAVSYTDYLYHSEQKIKELQQSSSEEDRRFLEYYQLGLTRMHRVGKTYRPDEKQLKRFSEKGFRGKILIISEGWCGDAAMIVPVVHRFFGDECVRMVYRDENEELISQYLTNGGKSIPIVLILDQEENVTSHWGPRPAHGMELLKKYKNSPQTYTADDFHNELQVYYTKNKGLDIVEEILDMI